MRSSWPSTTTKLRAGKVAHATITPPLARRQVVQWHTHIVDAGPVTW
jgi:hypothetical protein